MMATVPRDPSHHKPLVDQWYAWSHLIPSATAARNVTGRHLQIMDCSGGALRGIPGGAG